MAITDILSLVLTSALLVGSIIGVVFLARKISGTIESTKASLKEKGWNVSDSGISVKTNKRLNHEDYVDATQRGMFKAMQASSFGKVGTSGSPSQPSPQLPRPVSRHDSSSSIKSVDTGSDSPDGQKKRRFFRRKDS